MNNIFSKFTYGLYLLSSGVCGCIIDTAMQITSSRTKEVMMCVSINTNSDTLKEIILRQNFAVTVLSENTPKELIEEFGFNHSKQYQKFNNYKCKILADCMLLNEYSVGNVYCKLEKMEVFDTHVLLIGKVLSTEVIEDTKPLTYEMYKEM